MARTYVGTPLAAPLRGFSDELARERAVLLEVAERLEVPLSRWKPVAVALGERVGRLKPNGRLTAASPLSALLELEVLRAAVNAKRGLWDTLGSWSGALGLERERFVELDQLAADQSEMLKGLASVARDRVASGARDVRSG